MAISKNIETSSGIKLENAYGKIATISGGKSHLSMELKFYVDYEASLSKEPVKTDYISFIPSTDDSAPNFIRQGYEYIKTLQEYNDVTDC